MKKFNKNDYNLEEALNELMLGSGVIVFSNVFNLDDIKSAREIVNNFADTQDQKESHCNAEAEASGKINLQQRVWNLFGKGNVFSKLITDEIFITGFVINGILVNKNGTRTISNLEVQDEDIINIVTEDTEMFSKKALYDEEKSIIELFNNVKIIRGSEIITGDYGILDTSKNAYKVSSKNSNKVKVIISNTK